ncbi:serine hydrolase domain-containing protein [Yoonia sp. GPGPB17]|uniref:serine hydrolase domain-containing protein n=1 Tax=Yoonia sp. GPGPB17 TaxID=3026147 RepID=UPI0030C0B282
MTGPFAFCGMAVAQGGQRHFAISHAPFLNVTPQTMFRVASVSKVVVGRVVASLVDTTVTTWDTDVSKILGWTLEHPKFPERPVTLGMLASHSAGLDDDAGYLIPPHQTLRAFCAERAVFDARPGAQFCYSNLGYIVLAEVIEALSGLAFPDAVAPFLPKRAGFNWVGVSDADRQSALPTYRRSGAAFLAQVDQPPEPAKQGHNPGIYSPQGGLRTSLEGMLDIACGLGEPTALWTPQMGPGNYLDGVFESYGAGVQIFDAPLFYPRPLVGHFGNAYGFNGGVWYDRERNLSFAYALNGLEMNDESDAFSEAELAIFQVIANL